MGKRVIEEATLSGMADHIRSKTGKTDSLVLPDGFNSGVDEVFAAGENSGWYSGYDEGTTVGYGTGEKAGKQAERDRWWDDYQQNGARTDYSTGYGGIGWTEESFKPKYDMIVSNAYMMFRYFPLQIDLMTYLGNLGVSLDFSQCTSTQYIFQAAKVTGVGVVDARSAENGYLLDNTFAQATNLVRIAKIILTTGRNGQFNNTFGGCSALVEVRFEGEINSNGLNLSASKSLSRASIENIVSCLSTTTSGLSITLSKAAVNAAFTDAEWAALVAIRNNWTINLI